MVVALDDRGKEALASDPIVESARAHGWAVCGVDPRGIGESATDKTGWVFAVSLLLGENFVGRQAWDLRRVLEALGAAGGLPRQAGRPLRPRSGLLSCGHVCDRPSVRARADPVAMVSPPRRVPELPLRGSTGRGPCPSRTGSCPRIVIAPPPSIARSPRRSSPSTPCDRSTCPSFSPLSQAEGLIVNPLDGDQERLLETVARGLLPNRVRVVSADDPGQQVDEFLQGVLGPPTGSR